MPHQNKCSKNKGNQYFDNFAVRNFCHVKVCYQNILPHEKFFYIKILPRDKNFATWKILPAKIMPREKFFTWIILFFHVKNFTKLKFCDVQIMSRENLVTWKFCLLAVVLLQCWSIRILGLLSNARSKQIFNK